MIFHGILSFHRVAFTFMEFRPPCCNHIMLPRLSRPKTWNKLDSVSPRRWNFPPGASPGEQKTTNFCDFSLNFSGNNLMKSFNLVSNNRLVTWPDVYHGNKILTAFFFFNYFDSLPAFFVYVMLYLLYLQDARSFSARLFVFWLYFYRCIYSAGHLNFTRSWQHSLGSLCKPSQAMWTGTFEITSLDENRQESHTYSVAFCHSIAALPW